MSAAKRAPIVSRAVLEQRLERQRCRLLAAEGICRVGAMAACALEDGLHEMTPERMVAIRATFEGLAEQLDSVKNAIDDMLEPATEGEIEEMQS